MKQLLAIGLVGVIAGCGGGSPSPAPSLPDLTGVWQVSAGSEVLSLGDSSLKFLQLNADGTGRVYATQTDVNVLSCVALVYAVASQTTLSIASAAVSGVELFVFQKSGDTGLSVKNKEGVSQSFTKASAVAASSNCESANVTARLENIPVSSGGGWSNLLSDGTNLKAVDNNGVLQTINPTTGALSAPTPIPGAVYRYFVTMQGADSYWGTCACGNVEDIKRAGAPPTFTESDSINTRTDLSNQIVISTGAFDGTHLWLGGRGINNNIFRFLQVNSAAEPDTLVGSFEFKANLSYITFISNQLWGLTNLLGSKLILIDSATRKATLTVNLPSLTSGSYSGLTALGGKLYLLVRNNNNSSSVVVVQP